jgi:osmoprotectant transport system ATP-binding protein
VALVPAQRAGDRAVVRPEALDLDAELLLGHLGATLRRPRAPPPEQAQSVELRARYHRTLPAQGTLFVTSSTLEFRNVSKTYEGSEHPAIRDLSLEVPAGDVCVLVGPSGCGKTTAMRLVNRMIEMTGGDILLDGTSVRTRDPSDLRREIGYAIQQIGLFPHLTIADNIATVPRLLGWSRERIRARVDELLELIGLDPAEMRGRYPAQLSGGQRQRVGVARALAADPPLLLMDEPFGAIDPINRARLQNELLGLQERLRKTIVFVTHDIDEAIKMGDRIAVMKVGGVLAQYATPAELLMQPADDFVEDFVGADRALKRLALTRAGEVPLREPDNGLPYALVRDEAGRPVAWERSGERHPVRTVRDDESLRDALSDLLRSPVQLGAVVGGDGRVLGVLGLDVIHELLEREADEDGGEPDGPEGGP